MHGGGSSGSGPKKKARIEIIPLIDVIFFLLATFVLFTLSLNKSNGVPVLLPNSETGYQRDTGGTVTVSVTDSGAIGWDKEMISLQEFISRLQAFHIAEPKGRILINGDENALFNSALYVFDEARKANFEKIYIETQLKQGPR
jgi:biopolymer transport protein ExbD